MTSALRTYLAHCERNYDTTLHMVGQVWSERGYHCRKPDGAWVHPTRTALDYALALLQTGEATDTERAVAIISQVLTLQDTDSTSATYGIWPWLLEEPLSEMAPPDWNWADFLGARLVEILAAHERLLPNETAQKIRASLGHAAWSIFRRNIGPHYTNIALMGAAVTLAAGEMLNESRLVNYGRKRLRHFAEHTDYHGGFNEYNSPTYSVIALEECERILRLVSDPVARADAESLRCLIWQTIAEHYHPGTNQWAGPHSRTYSDYLTGRVAQRLSSQVGTSISPHPSLDSPPANEFGDELPLCPPELVARFQKLPKAEIEICRRFIRREPEDSSTYGTTWLTEDACLGSVNFGTAWNQCRPVLAYWRTDEDPAVVLRLRFLHDGRDFASASVQTIQKANRALSAVGLLTNKGDFHPSLDRPAEGIFQAEDFRLRYELNGQGVNAKQISENQFVLFAGHRRAVLHTAPARFDSQPVIWQLGVEKNRVYLDGVCYKGLRRAFDFTKMDEVAFGVGLELLETKQASSQIPLSLRVQGDEIALDWPVADNFSFRVPARPNASSAFRI